MSKRNRTVAEAEGQAPPAVTRPLLGRTVAEMPGEPESYSVNGKPVPSGFAHCIGYAETDQGKSDPALAAEVDAAKQASRSRITVSEPEWKTSAGTDFGNKLDQLAESEDPDEVDPFTAAERAIRSQQPHMAVKFFSRQVVASRGGPGHGDEGYVPALDRESGQEVRVADQVAYIKPLEKVKAEVQRDRARVRRVIEPVLAANATTFDETEFEGAGGRLTQDTSLIDARRVAS